MSTNINITVGDNALLDAAKANQAANRQAQLEREATQRLAAEATDARTKANAAAGKDANAAAGKDANGNSLYGVPTAKPDIDRRPAANRTSFGDVCVFWTDIGETLTVYSGDKSANVTVNIPSLSNPITPKYSTSASPTVSETVTIGSTSGWFYNNGAVPTDVDVYVYPKRSEQWYIGNGPIPEMPLPAAPEGYIKRYDGGTSAAGDPDVRSQINAYSQVRTDTTERSLLRSEVGGAEFSLPIGPTSCLYIFYRKYNWSCVNARQQYVYETRTKELDKESHGPFGGYGLNQFYGPTVYDNWVLESIATENERTVETLTDEAEQAFCFFVTKNSVKQVSFPDKIKTWLTDYIVYDSTATVTFTQFAASYSTVLNASPNVYEKPFFGEATLVSEPTRFSTGLVPFDYWQTSIYVHVGVDADVSLLSVPAVTVPSYPNKRLRSFSLYTIFALASYAFNTYGTCMTPWIYSILSRASSFTLNNSSTLVGGSVAQVTALLGEAPMRRQITISPCEPAQICTNDSIAFGYILNVYNANDFPSNPPEHRRYNKPLKYPEDPGANINLNWNWENFSYCRQQALALGFTEADLTP